MSWDQDPATLRLSAFGALLRGAGLSADTTRMIEFVRCAAALPTGDLYWAGRVTLVSRPEEIPLYDQLFEEFFAGEISPQDVERTSEFRLRLGPGAGEAGEDSSSGAVGDGLGSPIELVNTASLEGCSAAELDEIQRLTTALRRSPPSRRSRRQPQSRRGSLDLRRTIRRAYRTGGEPFVLAYRAPALRPVRTVLAIDVSGSMKRYCRSSLLFAYAGTQAGLPWRTFCFGTRTTEISNALTAPTPDAALATISADVSDLDGGTRIAEGLRGVVEGPGPSPVRGALVIIVSDGLETGKPADLAGQMQRISSLSRAVIWLNPLKSTAGYEPTAAGMKLALRWVSYFGEAHTLAALESQIPDLLDVAAHPLRWRITRSGCSAAAS
ncbi:vWA domain-containing protein [Pseudonocardia xishanensis]|uniref:VWA domain-containing protein n=1 Tax=Pseudonocardia xishanensis TaxID=630995 RepID=A0ABP8RV90_9PSEU